jgi:hypothetical protein
MRILRIPNNLARIHFVPCWKPIGKTQQEFVTTRTFQRKEMAARDVAAVFISLGPVATGQHKFRSLAARRRHIGDNIPPDLQMENLCAASRFG